MATELEKIVIRVEADLATLKRGLKESEQQTKRSSDKMAASLKKVGGAARSTGKALGAMALAAGAGLAVLTKRGLDTADAIDKGAKSANISVVAYQELSYAAALSGMSQQQLAVSLESFNRRVGLAKDGTQTYIDALDNLGISLEDGQGRFKTTEALLEEMLVALAGVKDTSLQASRASIMFGDDAGKKLPLMMKGGIQGLRDMRQEIHDLGGVLSADLIGKSVQAKDTLTGLEFVLKNTLAVVVAENAGAIEDLATAITRAIPKLVEATTQALEFLGIIDAGPRSTLARAQRLRSELLSDGFQAGGAGIGTETTDIGGRIRRKFLKEQYGINLFGAEDEGGQLSILNGIIAKLEKQVALEDELREARRNALADTVNEGTTSPPDKIDWHAEYNALNEQLLKAQGTDEARLKLLELQQHARREEYQALTDIEGLAPEIRQQILDTLTALDNVELQNLTDALAEAKDKTSTFGDSLNQAFQNAVLGGENVIKVLGRMMKQMILFGKDGTGGIFGGLLSGIFGGIGGMFDGLGGDLSGFLGFANGGRPMPGKAAIVGERGPELFVPDSTGTVYNNREMMGGMRGNSGGNIIQYWTLEQSVHFDTTLESVDTRIANATPRLIEASKSAVQDAMQRGGGFASTVRGY